MSPRFSILLPTRNGGKFLNNCIQSILSEQRNDIELIVSDNANEDETQSVLKRWAYDSRLKVIRQNTLLSVTENWNATLHLSTGDYVLMMGDDDCLLPGYFSRMSQLIEANSNPDCILYNACSYVAPNSVSDNARSFYSKEHFHFNEDFQKEFFIPAELRRKIVVDMFRFRVRIPLNMQTTLVSRAAANRVPGGIFQAPFPDHFALNAMLLTCDRWLFVPDHLVVVGVSPKSFGHYVYSNQQQSGLAYLGINPDFPGRLQGNELLNGMHLWLELLKRAFPEGLAGIQIDRAGYVRRQIYSWLMQYNLSSITRKELVSRFRSLSFGDFVSLSAALIDSESWKRLLKMVTSRSQSEVQQQWGGLLPLEGIKNIAEFAKWYSENNTNKGSGGV